MKTARLVKLFVRGQAAPYDTKAVLFDGDQNAERIWFRPAGRNLVATHLTVDGRVVPLGGAIVEGTNPEALCPPVPPGNDGYPEGYPSMKAWAC